MSGIDRRKFLIAGGAGIGLVVAYEVWPRRYPANLTAAKGEHIFGGFLKIGEDGHVTVAVPQLEHGQGSWTALPQIVADELGADWRTVAVEPAPLSPLYGNPTALRALFEGEYDRALSDERVALMATVGSASIRQFAQPLGDAGATARILLCKAAARRWGIDWQQCRTESGFVVAGARRARFGELAAAAADETAPELLPARRDEPGRLLGKSLPRLDAPAKVDGSANFAGDIRLPGMMFAALRQAPANGRLVGIDRAAADRVPGAKQLVVNDRWVAAIAQTWWAASKALDACRPRFAISGAIVSSDSIAAALTAALDGPGERMAARGDLSAAFKGARVVTAEYRAGPGVHAALETTSATARFADGTLELWLPTQAPGAARAAAAAVLGIDPDRVTLHNVLAGGAFGERLETRAAEQVALLARETGRPIQLIWSRAEDLRQDRLRAPAAARLSARLTPNGQIMGWLAKLASPATGRELAGRIFAHDTRIHAALALPAKGDPYATGGALPPYAIPAFAIDHHPCDIALPTGHWRGGAHAANVFFRECFMDELAHVASSEALSFRIGMLGGDARLARCLSTAAALGGWEGGIAGSGQGIAAHAMRGSRIAVLAEAHHGDGGVPVVDRLVAAVDCGRMVNPDLVRQQVESGLILGLSAALGMTSDVTDGIADARSLDALALPRLGTTPDISVELIPSEADWGGVAEIGIPAVAPAIANALQAATGARTRTLPLVATA
ncbi:MAG: molybdopterin cofactor-binding domain-containing protein [Pseudomonadota bacterium]